MKSFKHDERKAEENNAVVGRSSDDNGRKGITVAELLLMMKVSELSSKNKLRNLVKSGTLRIDRERVDTIDATVGGTDLERVETLELGDFLTGWEFKTKSDLDEPMRRFFFTAGFVGYRQNEMWGVVFRDYFTVSVGKKRHWIVRI